MLLRKIPALLLMLIPALADAQSSYTIPGGKEEWLFNRVDIKGASGYLRFSSIRPYNRKYAVDALQQIDTTIQVTQKIHPSLSTGFTRMDHYNMQCFLMANSEWSRPSPAFVSRQPLLKRFYRNPANAVDINEKDFSLIENPIIQYQQYKENNNGENLFLNSRGLAARGVVENKIGFSFYFTENQERAPQYVSNWVNAYKAVPGVGYYKQFKTSSGFDYFDIRSSLSWKVSHFMDMQLAYDRNFIGNGYRSLFLSDFPTNYMFLKVQTHFRRLQYQNIFAELTGNVDRSNGDYILPRKYMRANYLTYAATKWLNLGLFEATILGGDRLHLALFNPLLYADIPSTSGNIRDRHYFGFDAKANLLHTVQLYGQLLIDRLNTKGLSEKTWDNRFGYQLGLKYVDAFGLRNLDLQVETNRVRPYTYASSDSITLYSHFNQPLAHPLGANFQESIGIVRYQPLQQLYLQAKVISYKQGKSFAGYNVGNNIFNGFTNRLANTGVEVAQGDAASCLLASFLASYEVKQNLFIEASFTKRDYKTAMTTVATNTSFASFGIRWNMARRDHDF